MHCFIHRHHYIILLLRLSLLLLLLLLQHLFLHVHVTFSFFILPPSDTWCFVVRHLISVVPAEPMSYTHVGTCTNPAHTHTHTCTHSYWAVVHTHSYWVATVCPQMIAQSTHSMSVLLLYMYLYYIYVHCSQQPEIVSLPWTVDIGELWHCGCCCLMWFSVCNC